LVTTTPLRQTTPEPLVRRVANPTTEAARRSTEFGNEDEGTGLFMAKIRFETRRPHRAQNRTAAPWPTGGWGPARSARTIGSAQMGPAWIRARAKKGLTSAELRLHLRRGTISRLGTFFLIAEATRHHACAALPTPAFIGDQNDFAVTMTFMAV
jgi:hypothetical protein